MYTNQSNVTAPPDIPFDEILPGLITEETKMLINDVFACGIQPFVTIIGLAGNILSMTVLVYQGAREVTNIVLIGLTLVDLLYLLLCYGPPAECFARRFDVVAAINVEVEYKYMPLVIVSNLANVSKLYTCLIAVERYIAVIHPLKAPALLTRKKIFIACVILTVLPFAVAFHTYMLFDVEEVFNEKYNVTVKAIRFSTFTQENIDFVVLYHDLILTIPFSYVPVVLVLFCTVSILLALKRSQRHRLQMTAGRQEDKKHVAEQRQVTKVLIGICIVFIVCSLPNIAVQVGRLMFQKDGFSDVGRYRNLSFVTITVAFLFSLINSSVNFIFYVAYSKKFTATAKKIFLRWKKANHGPSLRQSTDVTSISVVTDSTDVTSP